MAKVELSWAGHLAAFKMLILPQILYMFRTLHIPTPKVYLKSLYSLLKKLIWQGKTARSPHSILIKHRSVGGMRIMDIYDCHTATHTDQLKHWFSTQEPPMGGHRMLPYKNGQLE